MRVGVTPDGLVRRFLLLNTGCAFAQKLASSKDGMLWATAQGPDAEYANIFLSNAAKESKVGALVYPELRSAADVAELLVLLKADGRWEVTERQWKDYPRDGLLLWARWKTDAGEWSSVMGMAPLGSMPVHRRAPYVTLIVWPGGRENPQHQTAKGRTLGFLDVKLPSALLDDYDDRTKATEHDVATMSAHTSEGAARHDVTFCLSADVRSLIFPA